MTNWTAGYVADIGYTFGYIQELNPLRSRLAFLNAGFVPSEDGVHCELGYGQGISANIHAAASGRTWYGSDCSQCVLAPRQRHLPEHPVQRVKKPRNELTPNIWTCVQLLGCSSD